MLRRLILLTFLGMLAGILAGCPSVFKRTWSPPPPHMPVTGKTVSEDPPAKKKTTHRVKPKATPPPKVKEKAIAEKNTTEENKPIENNKGVEPEKTSKGDTVKQAQAVPVPSKTETTEKTKPKTTAKKRKPRPSKVAKNLLKAPKPILPKEPPPKAMPVSTIVVPVTVSLGDVINVLQLEAKTPRGEDFNDFWGPFPNPDSSQALKYKWERHNFSLATQRNEAQFNTQFNYQFEYAQKKNRPYPPFTCCIWDSLISCGKSDKLSSTEIVLKTEFSLRADWRMVSNSKIQSEKSQGCENSKTNKPLIAQIQSRLTRPLENFAKGLDEKSTQFVNLKPFAQAAWDMLSQPIAYDSEAQMWLSLNPEKVKVTPIELDATTARLSIGIESHPRLSIGKKPQPSKEPLPDILLGSPEPGYKVEIKTLLKYQVASEMLMDRLPEEPILFDEKRKNSILNTKVYGNNVKLVIAMDLEGSFNGRVYFSGKPQYDPATKIFSVPDLDFDLRTRDWLSNKYPWMLSDDFIARIRKAAQWDLTREIKMSHENLTKLVNKQFSTKERFTGDIKEIEYQGIRSNPNAFIVCSIGKGELKFFLE